MLQAIQKFGRALKRDYLPHAPEGSKNFTFAKEYAMNLAIVWGVCGILACALPFPAVGGILVFAAEVTPAIFFMRLREIRKEMNKRTSGNILDERGEMVCLSGPGRQVSIIENTQKLVRKMTTGCEETPDLPAQVRAKLAPYVGDGAEAAASVNATQKSQPQERISFLRRVFSDAGEKFCVAAAVLTPFGIEKKKAADYAAAVDASVARCQTGLAQPLKVRSLRLKREFLA